jgi:SPP1 family predicted phage head-tail adaptor
VGIGLAAGLLRHRVTVQVPGARVSDGSGGFTETWTALGTVWAAIEPATAANVERRVGRQVEAKVSHLLTIRYLPGVVTTGRVLFGSRIFWIRGIANRDERNVQLTLACDEKV